jgi:hypothetical protein
MHSCVYICTFIRNLRQSKTFTIGKKRDNNDIKNGIVTEIIKIHGFNPLSISIPVESLKKFFII